MKISLLVLLLLERKGRGGVEGGVRELRAALPESLLLIWIHCRQLRSEGNVGVPATLARGGKRAKIVFKNSRENSD